MSNVSLATDKSWSDFFALFDSFKPSPLVVHNQIISETFWRKSFPINGHYQLIKCGLLRRGLFVHCLVSPRGLQHPLRSDRGADTTPRRYPWNGFSACNNRHKVLLAENARNLRGVHSSLHFCSKVSEYFGNSSGGRQASRPTDKLYSSSRSHLSWRLPCIAIWGGDREREREQVLRAVVSLK